MLSSHLWQVRTWLLTSSFSVPRKHARYFPVGFPEPAVTTWLGAVMIKSKNIGHVWFGKMKLSVLQFHVSNGFPKSFMLSCWSFTCRWSLDSHLHLGVFSQASVRCRRRIAVLWLSISQVILLVGLNLKGGSVLDYRWITLNGALPSRSGNNEEP